MLTAKQELFARRVAEGKPQAEAFREAYNTDKYTMKSIHEKASYLMSNVNIKSRVIELQAPAIKATGMTLQGHLERLAELAQLAAEAGQYSAAVLAETNRGKAVGYYTQRIEATISHPTSIVFALDNDIEDAELIDG